MTPDVNLLVAASRTDHPHHAVARAWLEEAVAAGAAGAAFTLMPMVLASGGNAGSQGFPGFQPAEGAVGEYNGYIRRFPYNLTAKIFGQGPREYFEAEPGAEQAPEVDLQLAQDRASPGAGRGTSRSPSTPLRGPRRRSCRSSASCTRRGSRRSRSLARVSVASTMKPRSRSPW